MSDLTKLTKAQLIALVVQLHVAQAPVEVVAQVVATCGAPTIAGTPCTVKGTRKECRHHGGRTDEELLAHAKEVQAKKDAYLAKMATPEGMAAKVEYAAKKAAKKAARARTREANLEAAKICRAQGVSTSGPEWAAIRDALLHAQA
jgi:siroheme synthase